MATVQKKKLPPIVPKKNPSLSQSSNRGTPPLSQPSNTSSPSASIPIAHLIARPEPAVAKKPAVKPMPEISRDTTLDFDLQSIYSTPQAETSRLSHEPKPLTFDDLMSPKRRTDLKFGSNRSAATPIERRFESHQMGQTKKPTKPAKPANLSPQIKPKPKGLLRSTTAHTVIPKPSPQMDSDHFLNHTLTKRLQMSSAIPLPGLAKTLTMPPQLSSTSLQFSPHKSHTIDNSNISASPQKLTHPNKSRAKGPKRRLPKNISPSTTTDTASVIHPIAATDAVVQSLPLNKKRPPPVPSKAKKPLIYV